MKLLIILALVAYTTALTVTVDKCAYGPSYWCSSIKIAKQCGAFEHCLDTVWAHQKLEQDGSDVCQFCESIVGDVRKFLTDQTTQAEIQQFLDSACAILPDTTMATECKTLVDSYLTEILALISTEMDPKVVCAAMGLCSGFKDQVQHRVIPMPVLMASAPKMEPVCTDCKKFFGDIKTMITDKTTEKEIEQLIEQQLCEQMGALKDYCKQMVEQYAPEIFELLAAEFDPSMICGAFGFCNATKGKALFAKMKIQKSPLFLQASRLSTTEACTLCKTVLTELQTLDKDKTVQADVETFLKTELCARLGSLKDTCTQTVDSYAPILFELLASELDPDTLCRSLGFCSADRILENVIRQAPKKDGKLKKLAASTQCVMCEFVLKEVQGLLENNATTQDIIAALDKVCSLMPDTIKKECTAFVDQYGPAVIQLLEAELDPDKVCTLIGLCKGTAGQKHFVADSETCGVCETVIQYVDSLLEENSTVTTIENVVEKICNFLPTSIQQECDTMVDTYGPAIIQLLAQFIDPKEICTTLGLCSNQTMSKPLNYERIEKIVPQKAQLLGAKECTWGPSYWCVSVENAKKCGAVSHCKKHGHLQFPEVWN